MAERETTEIFVVSCDFGSTVHVSVNGVCAAVPVGENFPLDNRLLPALTDAEGILWRVVGEAGGRGAAGGRAAPAADAGETFDPAPIIAGSVTDVVARLAALTPDQLLSVREAEAKEGAAKARKGVLTALDKAIAATN